MLTIYWVYQEENFVTDHRKDKVSPVMIDNHWLLVMFTYISMGALPGANTGIIYSYSLAPLSPHLLVNKYFIYMLVWITLLPSWDVIIQKVFVLAITYTHMKIVKCITIKGSSNCWWNIYRIWFLPTGTKCLPGCGYNSRVGSISLSSKVHVCSLEC